MFTTIYKVLAVLFIGFAGGAISPWVLGWIKSTAGVAGTPADAVAIANTYIVFTTFIFVGVTVILAIVGYVFTQQFSETKESQLSQITEELKKAAKTEEKIGIALIDAILENGDVKRHIDNKLQEKIKELILESKAASKQAADKAAEDANVIDSLASQITGNGEQP